jgi:DNA/RNA endonuclease YhcR with UshA esterase domain
MKKMKFKHYTLIFSIAGILVLYFLSKFSQAPLINIYEMPNYDGKQVTIEGIVLEYQITKYESQIITIENNNTITSIFSEGKTEIEFGDKIQATGEVQKYKDKWELIVDDINNLKILEKGKNITFQLSQLAENPTRYLNQNIYVTGYIDSISNSYFCLADLEKKFFLLVIYELGKNITIYPGQKVKVFARFSFDEKNFRYKLEINEQIHDIYSLKEE